MLNKRTRKLELAVEILELQKRLLILKYVPIEEQFWTIVMARDTSSLQEAIDELEKERGHLPLGDVMLNI